MNTIRISSIILFLIYYDILLKNIEFKSFRFSLVSEGIDDLTPQVMSEKLFCASEGQRK